MLQAELRCVLVTNAHLLSANIATRGQRLLEVLGDHNTEFLHVGDTHVYRRQDNVKVADLQSAIIPKANIALAIPTGTKHEAPQKRTDSFIQKKRFDAFLVVSGYEVRGELALRGGNDPLAVLYHELGNFFPVPEGRVTLETVHGGEHKSQVVIVNKKYVSLFNLQEQTAEQGSLLEQFTAGASHSA